jgi:acetyl esterase/lipase
MTKSEGDATFRTLVYKRVDGHELTLDVFAAAQTPSGMPAPAGLVLFHGGAWERGSAAQFHPQCRHFSQIGLTCISVDYRVRSRHGSSPADAVVDARDAILFIRQHASAIRIDPTRIAAGGGSAGGHLAAALGVAIPLLGLPSDSTSWRPDALILLNPMLDLGPGKPDHERVLPDWKALSPRHHVGPGVPRTLIVSGTADTEVPVATVQDFCSAVRSSGGQCDVVLFDSAAHGFFNPKAQAGRFYRPAIAAVEDFLRSLGYFQDIVSKTSAR